MKKILLGCFIIAITVIGITALSLGATYYFLTGQTLSKTPLPRPTYASMDLNASSQATGKLAIYAQTIAAAQKENEYQTATITLTKAEVDAMARMLLSTDSPLRPILQKQIDDRNMPLNLEDLWIEVEGDHLRVSFSKDTHVWSPFGSIANMTANVVFRIHDGVPEFKFLSACLGKKQFNATDIEKHLEVKGNWEKVQQSSDFKELLNLVKRFEVKDNVVTMEYFPYQFKQKLNVPILNMVSPANTNQE